LPDYLTCSWAAGSEPQNLKEKLAHAHELKAQQHETQASTTSTVALEDYESIILQKMKAAQRQKF
jgi:hypothetical protein